MHPAAVGGRDSRLPSTTVCSVPTTPSLSTSSAEANAIARGFRHVLGYRLPLREGHP